MKQADGGYAQSYNAQINTDAANKIIVAAAVTQAGSDFNELESGVARVEANTGQTPKQVLVDRHYTTAHNIVAMSEKGIEIIGVLGHLEDPSWGVGKGLPAGFQVADFSYDPQQNVYTCPAGKTLRYKRDEIDKRRVAHVYEAPVSDCRSCPFQPQCCPRKGKLKKGRSIKRSEFRPEIVAFIAAMESAEAKEIYRQRGAVAEFPNAWIKEKFGLRQFRLRGLSKVGLELLWASLTYNVKRWIALSWRLRFAT